MKKILKTVLAGASLLSMGAVCLTSCEQSGPKAGLIALHDSNSTYDKNFIDAFTAACKAKGYKAVIKTNIPESEKAKETAANLADSGCKFIFADSFGHEDYMISAAKEFKDVQFSHATGTKAHTEKLSNYHNAFASIYEGRYLAGVAAGLKLKEMNATKLGYVGAYPYAEVKSGYTSFYLGVKSVVADATMEVTFTGSWYDEKSEKDCANTLIQRGAKLISQHADSMGAPTACETAGVPNVSYNGSTKTACPNTYLVSSKINWQPYFEYCLDAVKNNEEIVTDYSGSLGSTLYNGSVALTEIGNAAVAGTEEKLNEVASKLRDGSLKVFDTNNFKVKNPTTGEFEKLLTYLADVDTDPSYTGDHEAIVTENGKSYFAESELRSAPYFDLDIEGITLL